MGTINVKGHKKLPPAPVSLNEDEIEKFGLEDLESEEREDPEEDDDAILDSAEADQEAAELEEEVKKVYRGLRVEDMVKVTAKNKFHDEDAVVRRLKDGKIFLRFYTYGTMYEEWMDPGDVRKLSSIEILKGLSGPQQPVTQRDFDGPQQYDRRGGYGDDQRPSETRRNMHGGLGGGPRNRRQDRAVSRFQRDMYGDQQRNDDNWNWYQEQQRRNQGGAYRDGDFDIRGSDRNGQQQGRRQDTWAQSDADSQWGRTSQRQNRREQRPRRDNDNEDWSSFISPIKERPSQEETDDFFASLMTDLSNDLGSDSGSGGSSAATAATSGLSSDEDDFFASLISEIGDDTPTTLSKDDQALNSEEDDFFASLAGELDNDSTKASRSKANYPPQSGENDFFASLAGELEESPLEEPPKGTSFGEDDFVASMAVVPDKSLQKQREKNTSSGESDFFASLTSELSESLQPEASTQSSSSASAPSLSSSEEDFFAALASQSEPTKQSSTPGSSDRSESGDAKNDEIDDFFANIGLFEDPESAEAIPSGGSDDFFDSLESDLESGLSANTRQNEDGPVTASDDDSLGTDVLDVKIVQSNEPELTAASKTSKGSGAAKNIDSSLLEECTVPILKEMLRERGLKVSGKKAELIERLAADQ